jgi:hypothetical protein
VRGPALAVAIAPCGTAARSGRCKRRPRASMSRWRSGTSRRSTGRFNGRSKPCGGCSFPSSCRRERGRRRERKRWRYSLGGPRLAETPPVAIGNAATVGRDATVVDCDAARDRRDATAVDRRSVVGGARCGADPPRVQRRTAGHRRRCARDRQRSVPIRPSFAEMRRRTSGDEVPGRRGCARRARGCAVAPMPMLRRSAPLIWRSDKMQRRTPRRGRRCESYRRRRKP